MMVAAFIPLASLPPIRWEGLALLAEGHHPQLIEAAGRQAGLPLGPLAALDEGRPEPGLAHY